jgi:sarcosine oxidase subunit gamma
MKGGVPSNSRLPSDLSDLPINRWSTRDNGLVARLGPDEWLVIGAPVDTEGPSTELAAALAGSHAAIVDVSQASVAFAVEGPDAPNILNAGCPLDFDLREFPAGSATRTIVGKCETIVFRLSDREFRLECARSFGEYLHIFLLEAAQLNASESAYS